MTGLRSNSLHEMPVPIPPDFFFSLLGTPSQAVAPGGWVAVDGKLNPRSGGSPQCNRQLIQRIVLSPLLRRDQNHKDIIPSGKYMQQFGVCWVFGLSY